MYCIFRLGFLHFTFRYTVAMCTIVIKNISNMHAISTSEIADVMHFNDKVNHC